MTSGSRWTAISTLPVVLLLEAIGWYMMRAFFILALNDAGYEAEELVELTATTLVFQLLGSLIVGALAIVAGPYVLLALGAVLATAGIFGFDGDMPVLPCLALFALGHGMMRPTIYGAAARALGVGFGSARTAYFFGMYITINLGASIAAPMGSWLREPGGMNPIFSIAGYLVAISALLAVSLAATMVRRRARDENSQEKPRVRFVHLVTVGVLTVVVASLFACSAMAHEMLYRAVRSFENDGPGSMASTSAFMAINPFVVIAVALLTGIAALLLQILKRPFPTMYVAGVGSLLLAFGTALALLIDMNEPSAERIIIASVIIALGEVLLIPTILARLLGGLPYRLETAVASAYMIIVYLPPNVGRLFENPEPLNQLLAWSSVGTGVIVGAGLIAGAGWLTRLFGRTN